MSKSEVALTVSIDTEQLDRAMRAFGAHIRWVGAQTAFHASEEDWNADTTDARDTYYTILDAATGRA